MAQLAHYLERTRREREDLYQHFHRYPELSMHESETSRRIAAELSKRGIDTVRVAETGLVATVDNGPGPVVAARADIDGLPVKEDSAMPYASQATQPDPVTGRQVPVAHACGHDVHIVSLIGALDYLHGARDEWSGTLIGVFQPGEETAEGARALVEAGIASVIPRPDVYLGQHVLSSLPGGHVGLSAGPVFTEAASIRVTIHGTGSHGSMPELSVDPVVVAASIVMRLQTIVAREVSPSQTAIVTVGAINAGSKSNIIPSDAELLINTRAYDSQVAAHLHGAIERIVRAECQAARCPLEPEFEYYDLFPLTDNDADAAARVRRAFDSAFGEESVDFAPLSASEDFSIAPDALGVAYVYWGLGGFAEPEKAPGNHNPAFAPDMQPTLDRGVEAIVAAAGAWLRG